jgi:8-oxo-dGTP diphosphatase
MIAHVSACLLFDKDNRPTIPFPNHWDLFGGFVEEGETAEQALVREIEEELGITITDYTHWTDYECMTGDSKPNIKHVYIAHTDYDVKNLRMMECGQRMTSIHLDERHDYKFCSILGQIIDDFAREQKVAV